LLPYLATRKNRPVVCK